MDWSGCTGRADVERRCHSRRWKSATGLKGGCPWFRGRARYKRHRRRILPRSGERGYERHEQNERTPTAQGKDVRSRRVKEQAGRENCRQVPRRTSCVTTCRRCIPYQYSLSKIVSLQKINKIAFYRVLIPRHRAVSAT